MQSGAIAYAYNFCKAACGPGCAMALRTPLAKVENGQRRGSRDE